MGDEARRRKRAGELARPLGLRAESVSDVLTGGVRWSRSRPARRGASAPTITWALVPLRPNELTPATRPVAARAHGVGSVGTAIGSCSAAMCGLSCVEVQVRRDRAVLQHQHDLDQAGDAGRRLEVAEVGLDRAEQQRSLGVATPAQHGAERAAPRSDRRAACRCRGPRRSRPHVGATPASASAAAIDPLLRRPVGRGQAAAAPVLVDRRAADDGEDAVAVGHRRRRAA